MKFDPNAYIAAKEREAAAKASKGAPFDPAAYIASKEREREAAASRAAAGPGPWDDYAKAREAAGAGPWNDYAKARAAATPRSAPPPGYGAPSTFAGEHPIIANVLRQLGLTTRDAIAGVTSPLAEVGDAANQVVNLGIDAANGLGAHVPYLQMPSALLQRGLTDTGLPAPRGNEERVINDAASAVGGGASAIRLFDAAKLAATSPAARDVLDLLTTARGSQMASAGTGAAAADIAREHGAGPVGTLIAALAGGLGPFALRPGASAAIRNVLRGPDGGAATGLNRMRNWWNGADAGVRDMENRVNTLHGAGIERPSVGQASGHRNAQALESALSKMPGSAGVMAHAGEREMGDIGKQADRIADRLSRTSSPAVAGRIIEKGISGPGGFVQRFKQMQGALYDKLDQYIGPRTPIKVTRTIETLRKMNKGIPGAENLSQLFQNAKIKGIEAAMKKDMAGEPPTKSPIVDFGGKPIITKGREGADTMPYEAMKKLRSLVGDEIDNNNLTSDVPRSKWKALYAALSKDLDQAAADTGNPAAMKAARRANDFSRAGYNRISDILDGVMKRGIPEDVYKAATNTSDMKAGATKIMGVMHSLTPDERDVVRSTFIRRMGLASGANQGAEGDRFSTSTFLTNWANMSDLAKNAMFTGEGTQLRHDLDQIAKAAEYIRDSSKVFANPSGTSAAALNYGTLATGGVMAASGDIKGASILLGTAGMANITARMMTSPIFVHWLARTTTMSPAAIPASLLLLEHEVRRDSAGMQHDIARYAAGVRKTDG